MILNGSPTVIEVEPDMLLVDVLRDHLGLKGTKIGCGKGDCGACTVIMDGKAVASCLIPVGKAKGTHIMTVEGLGTAERLHPLQKAFIEEGAVQCGFCTPGMLMTAKALLDENSRPTRPEIRLAISGNLCRCTGYQKIIKAIEAAAEVLSVQAKKE